MKKFTMLFSIVALTIGGQSAFGQWYQWSVAEGGNGHWYRLTNEVQSWQEAEAEAVLEGGHLVTVNDATEDNWLMTTFLIEPHTSAWIGLYQDPGASEPEGGWAWISGDASTYRGWHVNEPNDAGCGNEDWAELAASLGPAWNDALSDATEPQCGPNWGVIERDTNPGIPAVSTWGLFIMGLLVISGATILIARPKPVVA